MTEDRDLFLVLAMWSPGHGMQGSAKAALVSCPADHTVTNMERIRKKLYPNRERVDEIRIIPVVDLENLDLGSMPGLFTIAGDGDGDIRSW